MATANQNFSLTVHSAVQNVQLDDFVDIRQNPNGGVGDIWSSYLGENDDQSHSLENGSFKLTVGPNGGPRAGEAYLHFWPWPYIESNGQGFAAQWVKSGTFDPNCNRLYFWMRGGTNLTQSSWHFGTYAKARQPETYGWQGHHFYHFLEGDWHLNRWHRVIINRQPQHEVGANSSINHPEDPIFVSDGEHYFNGLTRFYMNGFQNDHSGDWYFDDFVFDTVPGEPDTLVSSIFAVYTGSRYELNWASVKNTPQTYDIYYHPSSIKTAGLENATSGGSVDNPSVTSPTAYLACNWQSPNMSENTSGMYFAIKPQSVSEFTEIYLPVKS